MGFVVEQHLNDTNVVKIERRNQALVYGKNEYMWEVSGIKLSMNILTRMAPHFWGCTILCMES